MTDRPPEPVRHGVGVSTLARRSSKVVLSLVSIGVLDLTWYGWQFVTAASEGLTTTDVFADNSCTRSHWTAPSTFCWSVRTAARTRRGTRCPGGARHAARR